MHAHSIIAILDNSMPCVNCTKLSYANFIPFPRSARSCNIVHTIFVHFLIIDLVTMYHPCRLLSNDQLCGTLSCIVEGRGAECHEAHEPTLTLLQYMPGSTLLCCNSVSGCWAVYIHGSMEAQAKLD